MNSQKEKLYAEECLREIRILKKYILSERQQLIKQMCVAVAPQLMSKESISCANIVDKFKAIAELAVSEERLDELKRTADDILSSIHID